MYRCDPVFSVSSVIETSPGTSSSKTTDDGIVVTGTPPTYATVNYWASIFPDSVFARFASGVPYCTGSAGMSEMAMRAKRQGQVVVDV